MDIRHVSVKLKGLVDKYKYAAIVLIVGILLLLLPQRNSKSKDTDITVESPKIQQSIEIDALTEILRSVNGVGEVQVLLSVASGQKTVYQTDTEISQSGDSSTRRTQTVIISNSQRGEEGLISYIDLPSYLGAIVVCEGADSAGVRLAITQAVSKVTGLKADAICVLKMK